MSRPLHEELIDTVLSLALEDKPTQADLRRSVSTSYNALFHWLAACCADMLVGRSPAKRSERAWQHVYRRLEHGHAKRQCRSLKNTPRDFPQPILDFAEQFVTLQEQRELADYAPGHRILATEAVTHAAFALGAIKTVRTAPVKDLRAFAVWVILPKPRNLAPQ